MEIKRYLSQAYRIDQRINSKLEQIVSLHELAMKATSTINDMPVNCTKNTNKMAEIISKIVDLESEINAEIDRLVEVKKNIIFIIKQVQNSELQTLLELRYLCFKTWEQIAVDLNYGIDNVYKMHQRAIRRLENQKTLQ